LLIGAFEQKNPEMVENMLGYSLFAWTQSFMRVVTESSSKKFAQPKGWWVPLIKDDKSRELAAILATASPDKLRTTCAAVSRDVKVTADLKKAVLACFDERLLKVALSENKRGYSHKTIKKDLLAKIDVALKMAQEAKEGADFAFAELVRLEAKIDEQLEKRNKLLADLER
jgi:hypothetical protein